MKNPGFYEKAVFLKSRVFEKKTGFCEKAGFLKKKTGFCVKDGFLKNDHVLYKAGIFF